jgi:hypothetical protein
MVTVLGVLIGCEGVGSPTDPKLTGITVEYTGPSTYIVGEEFDLAGLKVYA